MSSPVVTQIPIGPLFVPATPADAMAAAMSQANGTAVPRPSPTARPLPGMSDREYPGGMVALWAPLIAMATLISIPGIAFLVFLVEFARAWK